MVCTSVGIETALGGSLDSRAGTNDRGRVFYAVLPTDLHRPNAAHGASTCRRSVTPRGYEVPQILTAICNATPDLHSVSVHWARWVHLIGSDYSGHASAINVLARFGSAARGDPLYEVGVVIGRLLRTVFFADYFIGPAFRRELLRALNRGEATNADLRYGYQSK